MFHGTPATFCLMFLPNERGAWSTRFDVDQKSIAQAFQSVDKFSFKTANEELLFLRCGHSSLGTTNVGV